MSVTSAQNSAYCERQNPKASGIWRKGGDYNNSKSTSRALRAYPVEQDLRGPGLGPKHVQSQAARHGGRLKLSRHRSQSFQIRKSGQRQGFESGFISIIESQFLQNMARQTLYRSFSAGDTSPRYIILLFSKRPRATLSKISPATKEIAESSISPVIRIAVGKRGTSPVCI